LTTSLDDLFEEGEQLLDANDFAGARDAYRRAAIAGCLSRACLGNLEVATEQERLAFARELHARHPASFEAALALAHTLMAARRFDQAVLLCSNMLAEHESDIAAMRLRIVRLQAAAQGRNHETLVEDARAIWAEGEVRPAARKLRRTLLRTIAGINHAEAEQAVHRIAAALPEGPERRMLATKSAELAALADALRRAGDPEDPEDPDRG
jgi:hypothetical protein